MAIDTEMYLEDPLASIYTPMEELSVNASDGSMFAASGVIYWSAASDLQEVVMPNGVLSGGTVIPGTANDTIDVAEMTVWLNGAQMIVSAAAAESVTRGVTNGFIINAVTIDNAGAVAIIAGTEDTAFSAVIGAAGGPPYIPVDSILVAMVYLTSTAAATVLASEIKQAQGRYMEMALSPTWDVLYSGGTVKFSSSLPLIHTGDAPKRVYASYASVTIPGSFYKLLYTNNFKIPEETYSKTETTFHDNKKLVDISSALVGGTFDISFKQDSGIGSLIGLAKGDKRWLLVYPNKYRSAYFLCPPSVLSFERDAITAEAIAVKATVTMASEEPAIEKLL